MPEAEGFAAPETLEGVNLNAGPAFKP